LVKPEYDPNKNLSLLQVRVNELRSELNEVDPHILAKRINARYEQRDQSSGEFYLPMWGQAIIVSYPGFIPQVEHSKVELDVSAQALVMHHFVTTDGMSEIGRWISFAELPDGRFYYQAFQGYSGGELARRFGSDRAQFEAAAANLGGEAQSLGDTSYRFSLFPRVPLLVVLWEGDEDFQTSYRILFDASVANHLPTDACAIAGSMLTRRLIKAS
jgi:hypothetical protein